MPNRLVQPLIFAIVCMMTVVTHAQDKVTVQFLAFPKHMKPAPVELLIGEGKTIEIETPGNELSKVYKIPRLSSVVVGKTTQNDDGDAIFEIYGKAKFISASKQIILLMRKGKNNSDGFEILPLNGELADFKGGCYLFINASKLNIAGVIGDKKFSLKPGKRQLVQPVPNHKGGICQVTLAYQRQEKWKKFYDTRWPANKKYRSLIFFHQDPTNGRLGIAPIMDILP
ncbi:MAG: hypothetical protein AB8F34_04325 [Akkermansiaceae bacterium]